MSFAEKVHNRLLALESQVQAVGRQVKNLASEIEDVKRHCQYSSAVVPAEFAQFSLEAQVQALDKRLKAFEELQQKQLPIAPLSEYESLCDCASVGGSQPIQPIKRKPGRPKKVVNG